MPGRTSAAGVNGTAPPSGAEVGEPHVAKHLGLFAPAGRNGKAAPAPCKTRTAPPTLARWTHKHLGGAHVSTPCGGDAP